MSGAAFHTIQLEDSSAPVLRLLDQRVLPERVSYVECRTASDTATAIRTMVVRGAPAIGVTAGYGYYLAVKSAAADVAMHVAAFEELDASRPTAVNLRWALRRLRAVSEAASVEMRCADVLREARKIEEEDVSSCLAMGRFGLEVVPEANARILHHCNTGALATSGSGTALGVIRTAFARDPKIFVYVDETRPRLQGARLTAWECVQEGIDHQLIADSTAAVVMAQGKVDVVTVGADRVAADGSVANKIGTYSVAVNAKYHGVPFVVVAPTSTVDLEMPTGVGIPIEERDAAEVKYPAGLDAPAVAPKETSVFNPAFDVTPPELVTCIITECGIARPPYTESLAKLCGMARKSA